MTSARNSRAPATRGSSAAAAIRWTSTTSPWSIRTRRGPSSCWRRKPKTPISTCSSRCWRSPTTRTRKREPYHIVAEMRDREESRGGGAGGRQGGHLCAGRRSHRTGDRPDLPPVGAVGGVHRVARFRWRRDLLQGANPRSPGRTYREVIAAYEDSTVMGIMRANGEVLLNPPMDTHSPRRPGDRNHRGRRHAGAVPVTPAVVCPIPARCRTVNACRRRRSAS